MKYNPPRRNKKGLKKEAGSPVNFKPAETSKDFAWKKFLQDPVIWNFTKFLLDEKGNLVAVFHNKVNPMSEEILKYLNYKIENLLIVGLLNIL